MPHDPKTYADRLRDLVNDMRRAWGEDVQNLRKELADKDATHAGTRREISILHGLIRQHLSFVDGLDTIANETVVVAQAGIQYWALVKAKVYADQQTENSVMAHAKTLEELDEQKKSYESLKKENATLQALVTKLRDVEVFLDKELEKSRARLKAKSDAMDIIRVAKDKAVEQYNNVWRLLDKTSSMGALVRENERLMADKAELKVQLGYKDIAIAQEKELRAQALKKQEKECGVHSGGCRPSLSGCGTFVCKTCHRLTGYCRGGADKHPDDCDTCWATKTTDEELQQLRPKLETYALTIERQAKEIDKLKSYSTLPHILGDVNRLRIFVGPIGKNLYHLEEQDSSSGTFRALMHITKVQLIQLVDEGLEHMKEMIK